MTLFRVVGLATAGVLAAWTAAPGAAEQASGRTAAVQLEEFDRRLTAELQAIDPEAARLFVQANEARARQDHAAASALYGQVLERAPAFVHALRRQCHEELAQGHRESAIALCRNAVRQEESAENLAALAKALVTSTADTPARAEELVEATRLSRRASEIDPDDFFAATTVCQVAVTKQDLPLLKHCVSHLEAGFPKESGTAFYQMVLAAGEGRYDDAEAHLERARDRGGVPEAQYQAILKDLRQSRPLGPRIMAWALPAGAAWIGLLLVLLAAGLVLSRLALRAARRVPAAPEGTVTGFDDSLRRLYRAVLWLCCGYYYVSIPILVLLVLAVGGGIIYAFFWLGRIPIKLVLVVGLLTLYTLWAIVRSLFVRGADADPGESLDLDRHPRLRGLLEEVAGRVGTRTVDNVYMTPGTEIAVMERGGSMLARARGRAERCLILGAAVLDGMRLGPLKAILAHEYGHFSNRDTAGGGFALGVRLSLLAMGQGIARGGAAAWYNPAWLFVNGFYRVFLRISQGASRLQEVLADRWAALMYGSKAFEEGLRHAITRSVRFDAHAVSALNEVIEAKRPLANLYAFRPSKPPVEGDVETAVTVALQAPASPYDSHPSFAERIAWVQAMDAAGEGATSEDAREAWSLFPDREAIERAMTDVIRRNVRLAHGVEIAAP